MAAGRIGSNPPPTLSPAAMPQGEQAGQVKDTGASPAAGALAAVAAANAPAETEQLGAGATAGQNPNFGVQISPNGKNRAEAHKKALDIARSTPDVREDKVADFKKRIAEGSYQVDSGKIADGMMHEAIRDHLAETEK